MIVRQEARHDYILEVVSLLFSLFSERDLSRPRHNLITLIDSKTVG
jgi:hypothetical protein